MSVLVVLSKLVASEILSAEEGEHARRFGAERVEHFHVKLNLRFGGGVGV